MLEVPEYENRQSFTGLYLQPLIHIGLFITKRGDFCEISDNSGTKPVKQVNFFKFAICNYSGYLD